MGKFFWKVFIESFSVNLSGKFFKKSFLGKFKKKFFLKLWSFGKFSEKVFLRNYFKKIPKKCLEMLSRIFCDCFFFLFLEKVAESSTRKFSRKVLSRKFFLESFPGKFFRKVVSGKFFPENFFRKFYSGIFFKTI